MRKKIAQLEAKTKAFEREIVSLKKAESSAETKIEKINLDRDQAVRKLLKKLDVKLVSETAAKPSKKKSGNSKSPKTKKKTGETRSRKKPSAPKLSSPSQTEDSPAAIQKKPFFDTVFRSTTSNGNSPSEPELPPNSSSDELLDDDQN